jgi:hypothetical protein
MTDPMPRRPFTHLPPPPAGPAAAVRGGRSIRRRRRVAGTSAAALSMALLAGVALASASGARHASDQLVPAVPDLRHATSAPSVPAPQRMLSTSPAAAGPFADGNGAPMPRRAASSGRPSPAATTQPGTAAGPGYRTPPLTRTYEAPFATGNGARFCEATATTDAQGTRKRIDWCITAKVTSTAAGHDLSTVVCRDQTTDSALSFAGNLEADLVVVHNGRTVWRWSAGHSPLSQAHTLRAPAGSCWSWTTAWTDVDGTGRALPVGSYELVAVSLADQVSELPEERTTFTIS